MLSHLDLRQRLLRLDRQRYGGYRSIEGEYRFPQFTLFLDRAQSDPFAPPSRLRVRMGMEDASYPADLLSGPRRRIAAADFIARCFASAIEDTGARGLHIDGGGQTVLERTALELRTEWVEARFTARLPGAGRTILGREAASLLVDRLDEVVLRSLPYASLDAAAMWQQVRTVEDADVLRDQLSTLGLVAFVGDGSRLPRLSGASDLPLTDDVVPFQSPPELAVTIEVPHAGAVSGMGVPEGVTLIVGGGYHGKTTLLQALQVGVYDHIPGDGRERVVTVADAVKVRAEDGRSVERVDISPFLTNLPFRTDTSCFSTENASGSTSQAAGIMEALEVGTRLLLLDEDTSATNFMVRDDLMQQLVPKELEPITPYIDRVLQLRDRGTSTILVVGGDGDYLAVADRVIMMESYRPRDVTARARGIVDRTTDRRQPEAAGPFHGPIPRVPIPASLNAESGQGRTRVRATDRDEIRFGREEIELWTVDQLVEESQTRAVGVALLYLRAAGIVDGRRSLADALADLERRMQESGLGVISSNRSDAPPGDLARPRPHEIAAALNRLRSLKVRQVR